MITTLTTRIAGQTKSLSWSRYRHVALVLLLDLVLTAVFFTIVQDREQAHAQAEFERQAETYVTAIQKGIVRNLEVIESIGGLYAASGKVERDDFRRFVQGSLSRHREIQALSWNARVTNSERRQFEDSVRQEGYPQFQIKDGRLDGQEVVDIDRHEYIVVTYIEPYESNEAALGFDVASNPTRLAAFESARDTGEMIATARITLVQETGNQYGFLILKPIYKTPTAPETVEGRRQNLKGFAVGVFRVGDMVEAALEDLPEGIVNIQLVDEASPADEGLLYLGQASNSNNPADEEQLKDRGDLYLREPLEIPGRQWSILITPTSDLLGSQAAWEAWGVLAGGLLITALLIAYLITVINHGAKTQRLSAELTTANEGLKTEVTERNRAEQELRILAANLERSNRELEEFASVASHDLQEPLRKVQAFGNRLKVGFNDALTGRGQDYLDRMLSSTDRMQTLINDLLAFSRVSTKAEPFVPVDLNVVAAQVLADLEVAIEQADGQVEVGDLPTIDADPTQMRQLPQNLVSNSLTFRKQDEPPLLKVRGQLLDGPSINGDAGRRANAVLELTVEDNGIGFDPKYSGRIFNIFQRLNGRGEYPGTGIGLSICRKIAERHGGTITASSQPNRGATFTVTLPVNQSRKGAAEWAKSTELSPY